MGEDHVRCLQCLGRPARVYNQVSLASAVGPKTHSWSTQWSSALVLRTSHQRTRWVTQLGPDTLEVSPRAVAAAMVEGGYYCPFEVNECFSPSQLSAIYTLSTTSLRWVPDEISREEDRHSNTARSFFSCFRTRSVDMETGMQYTMLSIICSASARERASDTIPILLWHYFPSIHIHFALLNDNYRST